MQEALFPPRSGFAAFAAGNYMIRSERRRSPSLPPAAPEPEKKPPKKKKVKQPKAPRHEAGIIYKAFTILLSILIWPVGLIMLLLRYLKWRPFRKFIVACVTLALCVFLYGFLLTVNTGNPEYTAIQDRINAQIENIAGELEKFSVIVEDKAVEVYDVADDLFRASTNVGRLYLANLIDLGVEKTADLRTQLGLSGSVAPVATAPDPTESIIETTPVPTATPVPVYKISAGANIDSVVPPLYFPAGDLDTSSGTPLKESPYYRESVSTSAQSSEGTETAEATPDSFTVKPAGEAIVYFNLGSGTYYHSAPSCGVMKTADTHTLAEAANAKMKHCNTCNPPALELIDEPYVVWIDGNNIAHLSDECTEAVETCHVTAATEAITGNISGCKACSAGSFLNSVYNGNESTVVSTKWIS